MTIIRTEKVNNGEILFALPEGFHVMSREERNALYKGAEDLQDTFGILDSGNGTALHIAWKKKPFLLGSIASMDAVRDTTERRTKNVIPGYTDMGHTEREMGGQKLCGFKYGFTAQDGPRVCEHLLIRHKRYIYTLICAARADKAEYAEEALREILKATTLA